MLNKLRELNPTIEFYGIKDEEFKTFGRILGLDGSEIMESAEKIEEVKGGSKYVASEESFEVLKSAKEIGKACFGNLPYQTGYCWGENRFFNATEWHTSSEINIAVTDLVLILGHEWDIKDNKINSSDFKAFFVPKGSVIEVYATSLHFCPCQVSDSGFGCVVILPKDTNVPLEEENNNKLLFRKNKWILAHSENSALIERGVVGGIFGENYKIKY